MCAWPKNVLFHAPAQKRIPRLVFPDLVTTIQPGAGKPFVLVKFSMVRDMVDPTQWVNTNYWGVETLWWWHMMTMGTGQFSNKG